MNKKIIFLSAFLFFLIIGGISAQHFLGAITFDSNNSIDTFSNTDNLPPPDQKSTTPVDCETINNTENDYIIYTNVDEVVQAFLENQDSVFQKRVNDLSGGSAVECELPSSSYMTPRESKKIDSSEVFTQQRINDWRKADCALFSLQDTGSIPKECFSLTGKSYSEIISCYQSMNDDMAEVRMNLYISMYVALQQVNEIQVPWSLHKYIACVQDNLSDQREELIAFLEVFAKLPAAFMNAASQ